MDNHLHMECVEWASKRAHALTYHIAAVNGVKWSAQQQFMLSSGYDGSSNVDWYWRLRNSCFLEDEAVAVIKCHPHTIPICSFLAKGPQIMDIWWGKAVHEDVIRLGQELSLSLWLMASNVSLQVMYHTRIVVNLSSSGCFTRGTTSNKYVHRGKTFEAQPKNLVRLRGWSRQQLCDIPWLLPWQRKCQF